MQRQLRHLAEEQGLAEEALVHHPSVQRVNRIAAGSDAGRDAAPAFAAAGLLQQQAIGRERPRISLRVSISSTGTRFTPGALQADVLQRHGVILGPDLGFQPGAIAGRFGCLDNGARPRAAEVTGLPRGEGAVQGVCVG